MCIGSCIGSMLGSCCCAGVGNACKTDSKSSRLPYILTFVLFAVIAFILSLVGDKDIINLPFYNAQLCSESCARNGAIYRIGLCLTIFFSTHFIILCIPGTGFFHTAVYPIKLLVLTALVIWSFWWSNGPIEGFADWARWLSWIFLSLQGFMLIGWAWDTHDAMMARMTGEDGQEAEGNVAYAYVGLCLVIIIGSFILIGFFFSEYGGTGCSGAQTLLSFTIIFCVVQMVLSYFVEHGNGFVSSIIMLYVTYLNFQALATTTDENCNNPSWSESAPMYTGFVILIATLSYVGYDTRLLTEEERGEVEAEDADIESGSKTANTAHNHPTMRKLNRFFHFTMTVGSFYITMIMTNWGDNGTSDSRWYGRPANTWLIATGEWLTMLMYFWCLLAPVYFEDRDFGYNRM